MILHGIEYQRPTSLNMHILADHVTYSFLAFMKSIFHFCLGCYCGGYSQNGRSNLSSFFTVWCFQTLALNDTWYILMQFFECLDSKVHGANMGPTWVLSAPDGPYIGPMNLAIWNELRMKHLFYDVSFYVLRCLRHHLTTAMIQGQHFSCS